jgi:hypothetical protein
LGDRAPIFIFHFGVEQEGNVPPGIDVHGGSFFAYFLLVSLSLISISLVLSSSLLLLPSPSSLLLSLLSLYPGLPYLIKKELTNKNVLIQRHEIHETAKKFGKTPNEILVCKRKKFKSRTLFLIAGFLLLDFLFIG